MSTFHAVFEALPRQGPGSRACTARALSMCGDLPPSPDIVDLGCGAGTSSIDLAELTDGDVVAVDLHAPFMAAITGRAERRGVGSRVRALLADMADPGLGDACADLVWSEGALYHLGLDRGLDVCGRLLREGGRLAFTEPVWCRDDVPAGVREMFADYPAMGSVAAALDAVAAHGFDLLGHFTLPEAAWWDDFATPMRQRVAELRTTTADPAAIAVLDECDAEIAVYTEHGDCFAYEFIVARRSRQA